MRADSSIISSPQFGDLGQMKDSQTYMQGSGGGGFIENICLNSLCTSNISELYTPYKMLSFRSEVAARWDSRADMRIMGLINLYFGSEEFAKQASKSKNGT